MADGTPDRQDQTPRNAEVFHTYCDLAMFNSCKHSGSRGSRFVRGLAIAALVLGLQVSTMGAASAAAPPAESPGCETYGCLYEHCPTHYSRGGGDRDDDFSEEGARRSLRARSTRGARSGAPSDSKWGSRGGVEDDDDE